jgi:CO/xanthine dehydrogenase Mo-binding subunit
MAHTAQHHFPAPKMRLEDTRLITGSGKYAADWSLKGQLYGYLRADRAHAEIVSMMPRGARHPGVVGIYGEDAVRATSTPRTCRSPARTA